MKQQQTINSKHVLAANYIPDKDRIWSEVQPNITLTGRPLNEKDDPTRIVRVPVNNTTTSTTTTIVSSSSSLVAEYESSENTVEHDGESSSTTTTSTMIIPLTWPNAVQEFNSEFRYAIEYRKHQLWLQNQQPRIAGYRRPMIDARKVELPSVHTITDNDINGYITTFQSLIVAERKEILLQYENYTQYRQSIQIGSLESLLPRSRNNNNNNNNIPPPPTNGNDSNSHHNNNPHQYIMVQIPGIADSKPLPQRGDWLVLRPICYISMPVPNPQHPTHPPSVIGWSPACNVVDIHCTISTISRAVPSAAIPTSDSSSSNNTVATVDTIIATWLCPEEDTVIRTSYGDRLYQIRIIPTKKEYERCMVALLWLQTLSSSTIMNPLLFPTHAPSDLPYLCSKPFNPNIREQLNDQQASFVRIVYTRTCHPSYNEIRSPIILTGPAGTGKTKAMLHAILEVLDESPDNRILICAPSHTAANVITQRLASTKRFRPSDLFRLLDYDRNIATIPISILSYCYQATHTTTTNNATSSTTDAFDIPPMEQLLKYRVIVCTCIDAYLLYKFGCTNQQLNERKRKLAAFVQKKCADLNLRFTIENVNEPHFTHFFMDEAAQASETESLIPLSVVVDPSPGNNVRSRKVEVALVGDPRQLSPAVYSNDAAAAGMNQSWIERLLQRPINTYDGSNNNDSISHDSIKDMLGPELIDVNDWIRYSMEHDGQEQLAIFLKLNYRGHPSFLMIPSSLFYSDRLQRAGYANDEVEKEQYWTQKIRLIEAMAQPVTQQPKSSSSSNGKQQQQNGHHRHSTTSAPSPDDFTQYKQWNWPIHFRGVEGNDINSNVQKSFSTDSWCNPEEANAILDIARELTTVGGISTNKIGVMAPFRGQVVLIRKVLRANNLGSIDVGTIEDYQSAERDVILLSLTRSTPQFVAHDEQHRSGVFGPKQAKWCNVALTRAQNLLIVVGNPKVMVEDFLWRQFLWFCYRNVLWYGESGKLLLDKSFSWRKGEMQVVNSYNILSNNQSDNNTGNTNGQNTNNTAKNNIVVISSLERALRQIQ